MFKNLITKPTIIFITLMVLLIVFSIWLFDTFNKPVLEVNYKFIIEYLKVFQTIINTLLSNT